MRVAPCLVLLVLFSGCFIDNPVRNLARQGVEIRKVEAFETPALETTQVVVAPGDFVISGGGMRVVVGGLRREGEARGAVLEALYEGVSSVDSIALFDPRLYVAGVERRIRVQRMFILERAGLPVLRSEGAVELDDRVIAVARELSLGRVKGTLSMSTRASTAHPDGQKDVRVGARIVWGGPRPFIPGLGELADENWHRADWVGSTGATGSVVFGFDAGRLATRAVFERHGAHLLLLHTDLTQVKSFELERNTPHYEKSVLSLSASALAESVRRLGMWRGEPYREAWASVPYRPQGTEVELRDDDHHVLLSARPDESGRAVLPLVSADGSPPKSFIAFARAFGHAPSDPHELTPADNRPFELVIPRGGRIRVRVESAETGQNMPARVRLLSLEQAPPPSLGPDYRASGAGDTVITLAGDTAIDVPPGRYRVLVTHGPEWSVHEEAVDVTETFSPRVSAELEHQIDSGSWVACDLHVHAAPSPDSEVTLEDRLASLAAEGVHFAVATDHNHVTDFAPVASMLSLEEFASVPGVEITTLDPVIGHFNAYPYPFDPKRPSNGAPSTLTVEPKTLFRALHGLDPDLVIQINHPRHEGGIGYFDAMSFDARTGAADPRFSAEFDAIEVWNGFDLARPEKREQVFEDFLLILGRGQRVVATGSSDSHQVRYQLAGYPRTYAFVPPEAGTDPRAVVRAIRAGASFVTSGPFLEASIEGAGPGTTALAKDGQVELSVRVQAPSWQSVDALEVYVGGELFERRAIAARASSSKKSRGSAVRLDTSGIRIPVERDTFVIVRVSGNTPNDAFFGRGGILPHAFTNPIFVDADGDGRTPWSPR